VTVRGARAAALRRWHRDMGDNFTAVLPRVLDDLDAIDRAQVPGGIVPAVMTDEEAAKFAEQWTAIPKDGRPTVIPPPTDEQIAAWIERNPKAFADWAAKQVKVATPVRRTTRKAAG
jgi:hypothetical protein